MTRRYRVLLVSDAYAPMIGGAERATASVAANLQAREHAVAVATAWQPGLPEREVVDGVDVHRIRDLTARMQWISEDPRKHVPPPFPDVEATLRFRRLVKEFRPDVAKVNQLVLTLSKLRAKRFVSFEGPQKGQGLTEPPPDVEIRLQLDGKSAELWRRKAGHNAAARSWRRMTSERIRYSSATLAMRANSATRSR